LGNDRGKISSLTLLLSCRLLQNYYPERLGKALMIHVPYIFMKAWKMIYPFIDTNTRDKVSVLHGLRIPAVTTAVYIWEQTMRK
jgi:hypothetical protein